MACLLVQKQRVAIIVFDSSKRIEAVESGEVLLLQIAALSGFKD
jgi:hypothetical protein